MEKGYKVPLFDHGHVIYLDHLGSDQRVVEAARVSYQSESKGEEGDKKLLHYLFKMRHTSPFEQCNISFIIKMPIFCMRQFVRHRTFRLNEMSARYTNMWDDFYVPTKWRKQDTKNKQGSVATEELDHAALSAEVASVYQRCYEVYQDLISKGVAKEMARFVLPVANYTEIQVNIDLHNLIHFLRLRMDPHAQWEMRQIAQAMHDIAKQIFPWTLEAFNRFKVKVEDQGDIIEDIEKRLGKKIDE